MVLTYRASPPLRTLSGVFLFHILLCFASTWGVGGAGMFFFAFANAGVKMSVPGGMTISIIGGLVLGKTFGIAGFALAGDRFFGVPLPSGVTSRTDCLARPHRTVHAPTTLSSLKSSACAPLAVHDPAC